MKQKSFNGANVTATRSSSSLAGLLLAVLVSSAGIGSVTAAAEEFTAKASTELLRMSRDAVNRAMTAGASSSEVKRAEELLYGVGWRAVYEDRELRLFMQNWYLAMPAQAPDYTRFNILREMTNFEPDTVVSVAPQYVGLVRERVDLATAANATPDDFRLGEASVIALGWMALYGNDANSQALVRRLNDVAAHASPDYMSHTHTAYAEMLNLGRFAMQTPAAQSIAREPVNDMELLATGTGEVSARDGTFNPAFELWGIADGFEVMAIRFNANDTLFEIAITPSAEDSNRASGVMTPCEDGNCSCSLSADEELGQVRASCSNTAHPEHGELRIDIQLDGSDAAPQSLQTLATGTGEVIADGETRNAVFELLGDDEQVLLIRMDISGMLLEIAVDENDTGGNEGTGQLTPCDGGDCPCRMAEVDGGVRGSCSNRAYPEHGDMRFTIRIDGQEAVQQSAAPVPVTPPPSRPNQQPAQAQFETMATGKGEVITQARSYDANFEILGDGEQARLINLTFAGLSRQINIPENHSGNNTGFGQMTPCEGGNCSCRMDEVEDRIEGGCSNQTIRDAGDMRFILCLGGQARCGQQAVSRSAPAPAPTRPPRPAPVQVPVQQSTPAPVPQLQLLARGNGEFSDAQANFEFWGNNGQPTLIKISGGAGQYQIGMHAGQENSDHVSGNLQPCSSGGCQCELWEEGDDYLQGACLTGAGQESYLGIRITARY